MSENNGSLHIGGERNGAFGGNERENNVPGGCGSRQSNPRR